MLLIWVAVILLIATFMTLFHGSEGALGTIISLLPTLSGIAILVGGLIRWVMKRDRHQLLISKQHEKKWSCSSCQNAWTSQIG